MDPFEIQVYDGTADAQRAIGLELHVNAFVRGTRKRRCARASARPSGALHARALVWPLPVVGARRILADCDHRGRDAPLRRREAPHEVRHAAELASPPALRSQRRARATCPKSSTANEWGMNVRPIAAWENERWLFVINPIVSASFAGPVRGGPRLRAVGDGRLQVRRTRLGRLRVLRVARAVLGDRAARPAGARASSRSSTCSRSRTSSSTSASATGSRLRASPFIAKMILGYTWERFVTKR